MYERADWIQAVARCVTARWVTARWVTALLPALIIAGTLSGCLEADTLGDEDPDEVVIVGIPTWSNGMEELMQLKCGICHRVPAPKYAPDFIPQTFDLNKHFASGGIDGASETLTLIKIQVNAGTMPREYATPLTGGEKAAILVWDGS